MTSLQEVVSYSVAHLLTTPDVVGLGRGNQHGVLCMKLVDILLSSHFVKELEGLGEEAEMVQGAEDGLGLGKDVLMMLGKKLKPPNMPFSQEMG